MKSFKELMEKAEDTAVFTLGRFNPPTTGHEKLIKKMDSVAKKNSAPMYVFPTHSTDPKKNPLPHAKKVAYMKKMFRKYAKNIQISKARNVFEVAKVLYDKGHKVIIMVVGSDRVSEFSDLLDKYNGVKSTHGYYSFDNIEVISAGERDPDAEGVEGMSASKMRVAAADGDFQSFEMGLPSSFAQRKELYRDVRKGMGMREERDMGDMTDMEYLRDLYLTGKIWNAGDLIEAKGVKGHIVRKGTNYVSFADDDGKVHKCWIHEIQLNERNYRKEYDNYQGRPEQIARRSSRNKARRIMGDKAKIGMDIGHIDNDPMNNDPSNLRNEVPSDNRREPRLREQEKQMDADGYKKAVLVKLSKKEKEKKEPELGPTQYEDKGLKTGPKQGLPKVKKIGGSKGLPKGGAGLPKPKNTITTVTKAPKAPKVKVQKPKFSKPPKPPKKVIKNEVEVDEGKKLPPHLAKFIDPKTGNLKPDAEKRVKKVRNKRNWKDVTPKGFGPDEELDEMKSGNYALEVKGKFVAVGSKADMNKLAKRKGGTVYMSPGAKVGDSAGKAEEVNEMTSPIPWLNKAVAKIHQMTHPKGYENLVKKYMDGMKDKDNREHPSKWAAKLARQYKGVEPRDFARYINKLVDKGKLPQELKAEYTPEHMSFKQFVEVLNKNADQGDYIDDFVKSDAPQFKGKSKKKRIAMAVAAYNDKKRGK